MLRLESWWPAAEDLEVGQRKRVDHDCGDGHTLLVSRVPGGYRAFCFRCNEAGYKAPPAETLAEKLRRHAAEREADATAASGAGVTLPQPAVYDLSEWPEAAKLWLYKAGLGAFEIGRLGAYYHPPSARVVLPVLEASAVVFWQARALDGRQPKYLAPQVDRTRIVARFGLARRITLTEDILSAFKVGLEGEGWALMGTNLNDYTLARLLQRALPVNVWLDPDGPGQKAAKRIIKRLQSVGLEVHNIESPRDPKLMTRQEIKELVW